MEVTSVRVKLAHNKNGKVNPKAFVTIVIDNWLAIRDMRIIQGKERLFVAMPNRKKGGDVKSDIHESIALTLAESAAIPYGQVLSPLEMEQLSEDLFASAMPGYTPDGKITLTVFSTEELSKRFK